MTVKQENRVRAATHAATDRKLEGWHENPSLRRLQDEIKYLKEEISARDILLREIQSQNLRLENELENKEKRIAQNVASTQRSLDAEKANTEHFRFLWLQEHEQKGFALGGHQKASAILRLLAPLEHHRLRQDAMDLNPALWQA